MYVKSPSGFCRRPQLLSGPLLHLAHRLAVHFKQVSVPHALVEGAIEMLLFASLHLSPLGFGFFLTHQHIALHLNVPLHFSLAIA